MFKLGKLRVYNFKSFKEPLLIDFSQSDLTILNGPNGFGKTTIFDAIELCFRGKVGRIVNTDRKVKNTHVLKNEIDKITTVFLELIGFDSNYVIYASIPPNTEKTENNPSKCNIKTKILASWPESFDEDFEFDVINDVTIENIIGNNEIKNTFDIFNYIQQEDTCHFLKNKESERHDKISYLFGTLKQRKNNEKIMKVVEGLEERLNSISLKKKILKEREVELNIKLQNEFNISDESYELLPSGMINSISISDDTSAENISLNKKHIEDLYWISCNVEKYNILSFNYKMHEVINNQVLLKNMILSGHLTSYEMMDKCYKHSQWLSKINKRIKEYSKVIEFHIKKIDTNEYLTNKSLDEHIKTFPSIYEKYKSDIEDYYLLSREIGSYQDIISKISNGRIELRENCKSHFNNKYVSCPYCGDVKESIVKLESEFEKQSKFFDDLKSNKLLLLDAVTKKLVCGFLFDCINKAHSFVAKYKKYLKIKPALTEQLIPKDSWLEMITVKKWLVKNKINIDGVIKNNSYELIGETLDDRLNIFVYRLNKSIVPMPCDKTINDINNVLKIYELKCDKSGITNEKNERVLNEHIEQELKYLSLLLLKVGSTEVSDVELEIKSLVDEENIVDVKLNLVKKMQGKYIREIKRYEKSVAKQISIPFHIYSGKILQTRPDGNGAYLQSADTDKENGYIRFLSNIGDEHDAWNMMSSGQLSGLVISFMLAMNKVYPTKLTTLLIDDPVQTMDEINFASFVQLLKSEFSNTQLIMSTHENKVANFFSYKYQNTKGTQLFNLKNERLKI